MCARRHSDVELGGERHRVRIVLQRGSLPCADLAKGGDVIAGGTLNDHGDDAELEDHPDVRHIKVADASGRRLGRSFVVKLWPTLIFLRDGQEIARLVRPGDARQIREALAQIDAA